MQQNQDNLTNENPYSPPKSADFRQPENNNYQLTKGQKIRHILLGALVFSLLVSLLLCIFGAINMFYYGAEIKIIYFIPFFIMFFLLSYIIGIIFSICNEQYITKIKSKYIYSICCGSIIYITFILIMHFCIALFVWDSFSWNKFFNLLIIVYSNKKQQVMFIEGVISVIISVFFTIKILDMHRNYLYNKYFSGSLK